MIPNLPVPFVPPTSGSIPVEIAWGPSIVVWVVAGLSLLGMVAILAGMLRARFHELRMPRVVHCPERKVPATIQLEPIRAAFNSMIGVPKLRVRSCSMWPSLMPCDGACVAQTTA